MEIILTVILFVLGAILLAHAAYFTMRALLAHRMSDTTQRMAEMIVFQIAALHGLILALVFAQQMANYESLDDSVIQEASAINDVYSGIGLYGTDAVDQVRLALSLYVRHVVEEEWEILSRGDPSPKGWTLWNRAYVAVLDLLPATPRQAAIRDRLLSDLHLIAEKRQERETEAATEVSAMFWIAGIGGVALVSAMYFGHRPALPNLVLLTLYGTFVGTVLMIIFAFSDPFLPPGKLAPLAFQRLLVSEIGTLSAPAAIPPPAKPGSG